MRFLSQLALAAMFTAALSLMNPAMAGCRRMGFTVNDYGLEGPKRDAQNLLDKHISEWAAEQGIEKFNVGKKDVSCELYLNLIVFDEHTCTATATVCWGDSINRNQPQTASTKSNSTPAKKEATAKSKSSETKQPAADDKKAAEAAPSEDETTESTTTAQSEDDAKSETERETAAASKADNDETSADAALETATAVKTDADKPEVETGAIPVPNTAAGAAAAVSPLTADNATDETVTADNDTSSSTDDASSAANSAAAAAAEAAAAAAERAASAAERAAKAAERAAAALADMPKSSSSEGPAKANDASSSSSSSSAGSPVAPVRPTP
ncbi:hypothetical protein [Hyphomicrobium sp.]|uniref:hypothetical protein n=1 Tax=Hyphomicrobium sp. TaxID=82 RepID=UPI002CA20CAD|nr:hypothetical protein [Hyphomicrobium sp.]HRN88094.1 hypothetical protein [Hyphomicrobium sp.]HRQ25898.1 hypothetical protein [Hyphomicrobium sp.]